MSSEELAVKLATTFLAGGLVGLIVGALAQQSRAHAALRRAYREGRDDAEAAWRQTARSR